MNDSFRRRRDAMALGLIAALLLVRAGCVPADSTGGTPTTADLFGTLATFVSDFMRQILAAFLF
jgi:hypothetical protein